MGVILVHEAEAQIMKQFDFWSNNPCGADGNLEQVLQHRYKVEPWLPKELDTIPKYLKNYLEVGCGQGIDSFQICKNLNKGANFLAIDYSTESLKCASSFINDARILLNPNVLPKFHFGNALSLDIETASIDFVFSNGVLHHTPDPQLAVNEIHRVLKKGGRAKMFLYRKYSIKLVVAKILRLIQAIGDKLLSKNRF